MSETRDWTHSKLVLSKFEGEHEDPREMLAEWDEDPTQSVDTDGLQQERGELAFFGAGLAEMG